jgi:coatomer protein complex subunit alpha (xenin)
MKQSMINTYLACTMSMPGVPGSGSMTVPLLRNDAAAHPGNESLPRVPLTLETLSTGMRAGYRAFQGGKFNDSKAAFSDVLVKIPLVVTSNRNEAGEIKDMVEICREYITAIRIKGAMSEAAADPVRSTELSAYFTHCNLQPAHLLLALRSAMGTSFKHKNFIVAAGFARRLLELPDMNSQRNAELSVKATKVLQKSEAMARNQHQLNYKETSTFKLDARDLLPILTGEESVDCSYCGAVFLDPEVKGKPCLTCDVTAVGVDTIGLVTGS